MTQLVPEHPGAASDLATFARRVARFEPEAVIRIVAEGTVAGCFAETPFDALALRAIGLAAPLSTDVVVEAGTLAARAVGANGELELPPAVPALRWTTSTVASSLLPRVRASSSSRMQRRVSDMGARNSRLISCGPTCLCNPSLQSTSISPARR